MDVGEPARRLRGEGVSAVMDSADFFQQVRKTSGPEPAAVLFGFWSNLAGTRGPGVGLERSISGKSKDADFTGKTKNDVGHVTACNALLLHL